MMEYEALRLSGGAQKKMKLQTAVSSKVLEVWRRYKYGLDSDVCVDSESVFFLESEDVKPIKSAEKC